MVFFYSEIFLFKIVSTVAFVFFSLNKKAEKPFCGLPPKELCEVRKEVFNLYVLGKT